MIPVKFIDRVPVLIALKKLLCIAAVAIVLISSLLAGNPVCAFSGLDETKDLKRAVEKLNFWLSDSAEREGWQDFLLLNQLSSQAALGNQADLGVLQRIQLRFQSDTSGLKHPVFVGVKTALDKQIKRLSASREKSVDQLLVDAKYAFSAPSIHLLEQQRDQVIADIDALIRHYRTSMPSRKRALLFYDLQLDPIKEYLEGLEIEISPEISVGKIDSMIRDVKGDIDQVVEKIDAIPITPEPDDQDEPGEAEPSSDDDTEGLNLSAPKDELSAQILIGDGPSEDQGEETLEELESHLKTLEAKRKVLRDRRKTILKADLPRLRQRAKIVRQLRQYEAVFGKYAQQYGDPYFVIAANSLHDFSVGFLNGTSGNLQEDMLNRLEGIKENLHDIHDSDKARIASGKLGDSLRWLDDAGQASSLVTAVRAKYSNPNGYLSIHGNLLGGLVARPISDRSPIRQNAFGRLVRGCAETNGNVRLQLVDDPNQIQAQLRLDATVASGAFVQQGKIQVFTNSYGMVSADRRVFIGLDGVRWNDTQINADFQSAFAGTNSKLGLVNRIAQKAFNENQSRADDLAEQQAKDQTLSQFDEQTDKPLAEANKQLLKFRQQILKKSNLLPAIRMNSTHDRINVVLKQETDATLAAPDYPQNHGVDPEVGLRIHDTLLSNYLDPLMSGKTFTSGELAIQIANITGQVPEGITGEDDDGEPVEEFSIGFTRIRPIQIEFEDQKIRVVVSGRKFAQGDQEINAGMKIIMEFKVHDDNGQLKFGRDGKVRFEFLDPKRTTPALVAFRRFLDENLNKEMAAEDTETDLPANFIPVELVPELAESPLAKKLRLVQFRSDRGWLYLGWNQESSPADSYGWIYDLSAIWKR